MEREPVQRRRAVADDGIREAVDALLERAAGPVRLAVGEPAQLRADDDLDLRARAARQRRRLEAALAAADHDDPAAAIRLVVLALDREPDAVAHRGVEGRRGVGERRHADGDDDQRARRPRAGRRRDAEDPGRPLEVRDVGRVVLGHERLRNQSA